MLVQLNPPIPVETPKGKGQAVIVIDYGPDFDLLWVVFDDHTGECWTWKNQYIRGVENITMDRRVPEKKPAAAAPSKTGALSNGNGVSAGVANGHDRLG